MEYLIIFLVSCFFAFGIQSFSYLVIKPKLKSVFEYWSGILGDGILLPLANVFCWVTLVSLRVGFNQIETWGYSIIGGLTVTLLAHFAQERSRSTNWTMPEVGLWNLLGVYHVIFMFVESSFLLYTLFSVTQTGFEQIILSDFKYVLLMLGLFFLTFIYDYKSLLHKQNR